MNKQPKFRSFSNSFDVDVLLRYLLSPGVSKAGNVLRPAFFVTVLQLEPQILETKGKLKRRALVT